MNYNPTIAEIRALIPNVIHEVEGETSLADKLLPFINTANDNLTLNILGGYDPKTGDVAALARKIIVLSAFADAIPSLDIVLSPAGFAVISTEGRAPASKERVERLIASLRSSIDSNLSVLLDLLHSVPEWAGSSHGDFFRASFIPSFYNILHLRPAGVSLLDFYRSAREKAISFQVALEECYIGHKLGAYLLSQFPTFPDEDAKDIYDMIQRVIISFLSTGTEVDFNSPSSILFFKAARPILSRIESYPEIYSRWLDSRPPSFEVVDTIVTRQGGMFF